MNPPRMMFSLLGVFLLQGATAQTPLAVPSIAIDPSRPYIDIVFDRCGKRTPVFEGEGESGLWLKIRNNSILPIKVDALRRHNENPGKLFVDEIVEEPSLPVDSIVGHQPTIGKPIGYWGTDIASSEEIEPGGSLLFSVPLRHVTRRWSIRVEVFLLGPSVGRGKQPRTFVEFDWATLPPDARRASDAELFGSSPSIKK